MNTTELCSPVGPAAETDPRRRLLLVSYHFPPVGGAGVQRPVKFVKYLEQSGWETTALVAENPSVPVLDESLCADFPPGLAICRARTLEPGYRFKQNMSAGSGGGTGSEAAAKDERSAGGIRRLKEKLKQKLRRTVRQAASLVLQPDPQILWRPAALRAARRVLREREHHAILATAPPWSNLLLAEQLARETGLPLILDFRDEWDLGSLYLENSQKDRISLSVQQRMQQKLLRNADGILATTKASAERLEARCREAGGAAPVRCIYNGFDADDFRHLAGCCSQAKSRPAAGGTFRLAYTGTLWNLTSVEPLVQAVELLSLRHPELAAQLELLMTGRKTPEQLKLLGRLESMGCRLVLQDYCSHSEALSRMTTADGLCLLLSDVPGAERVVPAKLFEYLAADRELLAIVPEGETARLVRGIHPASHFLPADVEGICSWLAGQIASVETDRKPWQPGSLDQPEIRPFSREEESRQLAELLNETVRVKAGAAGGTT